MVPDLLQYGFEQYGFEQYGFEARSHSYFDVIDLVGQLDRCGSYNAKGANAF